MAEAVGFEPTVGFPLRSVSNRVLSASQPRFRCVSFNGAGQRGQEGKDWHFPRWAPIFSRTDRYCGAPVCFGLAGSLAGTGFAPFTAVAPAYFYVSGRKNGASVAQQHFSAQSDRIKPAAFTPGVAQSAGLKGRFILRIAFVNDLGIAPKPDKWRWATNARHCRFIPAKTVHIFRNQIPIGQIKIGPRPLLPVDISVKFCAIQKGFGSCIIHKHY